MQIESFREVLESLTSEIEVLDFCRKKMLHGTPFVFRDRDDEYYEFRKRIAEKFDISFHEIYITGSAKLGFSPFKGKEFDLDSDIDVVLVSGSLFDYYMEQVSDFQTEFRRNRAAISTDELRMYHSFLEYVALGWFRPDKLPVSFRMRAIKDDWFDFFRSISNGRSEVGNYKVNAGLFNSYKAFEKYNYSGLHDIYRSAKVKEK